MHSRKISRIQIRTKTATTDIKFRMLSSLLAQSVNTEEFTVISCATLYKYLPRSYQARQLGCSGLITGALIRDRARWLTGNKILKRKYKYKKNPLSVCSRELARLAVRYSAARVKRLNAAFSKANVAIRPLQLCLRTKKVKNNEVTLNFTGVKETEKKKGLALYKSLLRTQ